MKTLLTLLLLLTLPCIVVNAGVNKPGSLFDIKHYTFSININDTTDLIRCSAVIDLTIKENTNSISLDLKNLDSNGTGMVVSSVTVGGSAATWKHQSDRLEIIPSSPFVQGSDAGLVIEYSGIPRDGLIISVNRFGERTFFSDNWPDRASNYLPVVDHPAEKATVDFMITAPEHYKVVANGYLIEESRLPGNLVITHWKEEVPLPVKVMAFAAAPFAVRLAGNAGTVPVWTWVFSGNREEGFSDYSVAVKPVAFYSSLIGPYPFEKLANVQSKTIFGGLENAGCIFYAENSVTGQGKAEGLIAHEIAHQWFGNSVTETEWYHIWLSEGFATYLTNVYFEKTYGENDFRERMVADRNRVLRGRGKAPVPVIDTTVTNLMSLLNPSTYQKGGWVLHMLRNDLGDDVFWKGMRLFYSRYRNRNAGTSDFRKVMEEVSKKDLSKFFYQWLYIPGEPDLKISSSAGPGRGMRRISIEQTQNYLYTFTIDLRVEEAGKTRIIRVPVKDKITHVDVKDGGNFRITADPEVKLFFRDIDNPPLNQRPRN